MIVLITGGTGFIGTALITRLLGDGNNVIILTRDKRKVDNSLMGKVEVLEVDICDSAALNRLDLRLQNVDAIFHLAASLDYSGDRKELFQVNVEGTINLLNLAVKSGIKKIVFASSIEAMGMVRKEDIPANETFECKPVSTYGESKLEAEKQVRKFAEVSSLNITILRLGNVYGPGSPAFIVPIANAILSKGELLKFLSVYRGYYLHPVYIDDAVGGIMKASQKLNTSGTYILAGEEFVTIGKLFELVARALGVTIDVKNKRKKLKDILYLNLRKKIHKFRKRADLLTYFMAGKGRRIHRAYSIEKAKKEIGYLPRVNLKDGISKTLEWAQREGLLNR